MTSAALLAAEPTETVRTVDVEIVIPVFNEERTLAQSVERIHRYLRHGFPLSWLVTIADNASTDRTWGVACHLSQQLPGVRAVRLEEKGRGRALRAVWETSMATVVAYMDVDLSTDLAGLLPLVAPLMSGHSDLAIGSRLAPGAQVVRGPRREVISRGYDLILKAALRSTFSDAQCGFKAVRADVARRLLPLVEDNGWFFDTELLVLAERNGLRIHEVPVDWTDDPDSTVDLLGTAVSDLRGVARLIRDSIASRGLLGYTGTPPHPGTGVSMNQLMRFVGVGAVSTATFVLLFCLLYGPLGPAGADVVSLVACGLANLAANRRYTFSVRGKSGRGRHDGSGLLLTFVPLAGTLVGLALVAAAGASGLGIDLLVVTIANLVATSWRFVLLRNWVFGRPQG